ncbi:MAG: sugar transferase [Thermoguttaceae bacterium]|nr:sugar transferase [Thermoguttaceae bacterium]
MRLIQIPKKGSRKVGFYELVLKRFLDSVLSFFGLALLGPIFLIISLWIKVDDPGSVFFVQKRVGKEKTFFALHKFRTMKTSTPRDMPTHMLANPDVYLTRAGRFLRKFSLDELPQIWDIFRGKMSVIGPRPALWNQADLIAEREKYAANDLIPGLTGWAQINGRDELEIVDKAKLDGEYANNVSLWMDVSCFFGTIKSVAKSEGVVEGGTGKIAQRDKEVSAEQS